MDSDLVRILSEYLSRKCVRIFELLREKNFIQNSILLHFMQVLVISSRLVVVPRVAITDSDSISLVQNQ